MQIKKVITAIIVLFLFFVLAGMIHEEITSNTKIQTAAITDLPAPPSVPGMETSPLEQKPITESPAPVSSSGFSAETEINALKIKVNEIQTKSNKIATIESDQNKIKNDIQTLNQKTESLQSQVQNLQGGLVEGSSGGNTFGLIIDIILLLAVAGIITYILYIKAKQEQETIKQIKDYILPYILQGYMIEQLKPGLKQAGYTDSEIQKAMKEINQKQNKNNLNSINNNLYSKSSKNNLFKKNI